MMRRAFPALILGAVLACAPAAARQGAPAPAASPAPAAVPSPAVRAQPRPAIAPVQTIFGLTVVLAMLALFAWAMKRFGPRQPVGAAGLRIVGALNLGGRERLMVVEVGDQWIVVGASPGRVNALATMPKQDSAPGPATLHPHGPAASSFSEWLKQTIDKRNA
jgi:flagellar protein FliO/FliZ